MPSSVEEGRARPDPIELVCVDPADVQTIWPLVRGLIERAIRKTNLSHSEAIERDVLKGNALVWLAWNGHQIEAAATTSLVRTDCDAVCVLTACSGTRARRWVALLGQIEAYAKQEGCSALRIYGRKGWLRILNGYRAKHVIMEKVL